MIVRRAVAVVVVNDQHHNFRKCYSACRVEPVSQTPRSSDNTKRATTSNAGRKDPAKSV